MKTLLLLILVIYYVFSKKTLQENTTINNTVIEEGTQVNLLPKNTDLSPEIEQKHLKKRGKRFAHSKHEKDHINFFIRRKANKKNYVLPYEINPIDSINLDTEKAPALINIQ